MCDLYIHFMSTSHVRFSQLRVHSTVLAHPLLICLPKIRTASRRPQIPGHTPHPLPPSHPQIALHIPRAGGEFQQVISHSRNDPNSGAAGLRYSSVALESLLEIHKYIYIYIFRIVRPSSTSISSCSRRDRAADMSSSHRSGRRAINEVFNLPRRLSERR